MVGLGVVVVPAQTSRGTVTGLVTDPQGAVVAGAAVELINTGTNVTRSTSANDAGLYRFDAVDLGRYDLKVMASGFKAFIKSGVEVRANQTITLDAQLEVGVETLVVEVSAGAQELLQQSAPVRGGNIDATQISELPFALRNPANALALTLPGVSTNRYGFGVSTVVVNGSRGRSNNFLIDGTENNDISVAGQGFQIRNTDAIQEVSVQTGNYDAEFGRAGGAVVNVITRSGSNEFHGTLHYLLDSTHDDAITNTQGLDSQVQQRGHPLPGTEQWYGGTIGGPILRNRTFFFGSYQEQRQNSSTAATVTSLSAAGRAALRSLFPQGANANVDTYLTVTEQAVATSQFFTVPLGMGRPAIEAGTASASFAQKFLDRQWTARIDHKIGDNDQLSGRYLYSDQNAPVGGATLTFPGFTTSQANRYQNFQVAWTHVFSPSLTNELRIPYNRIALAFPLDPPNPLGLTLPVYDFSSLTDIGIQTNLPQGRIANNYVIQDTMTYLRGNHTFRFGFDLLEQRSRQFAPIVERGQLTYRSGGGFSDIGNFIDDFGGSGGGARRDFGSPAYYPELFRQAYFFQDRWRVNESLTLTLGLRYENFGNPINSLRTAAFTGLFNVDPVTFTGPFSEPNEVEDDNNNFSPTIGFAYSPSVTDGWLGRLFGDRRTVIRGGYQVGYDSFFNNIASNAATSSPNVVATNTPSVVSAAAPRGLPNVSGSLPLVPRPLSALDSQALVIPDLVNPYYQRWSFGLQRELPGQFIVDMSYVGTKGTKLYINEDMNPLVPASLRVIPATTPPIPASRLQGRLDSLQGSRLIRTNGGGSIYHAGQLQVLRRFADGFTLTAAYTYAKVIDNSSEVFGVAAVNSPQQTAVPSRFGGLRLDRAVSLFDRTHRAAFTYVYELPFMREQHGFVGRVLGGWQLSGVTSFETGVPLTVNNGQDADGLGGNLDRPDFNPNGQPGVRAVPSSTSPTGYVNPDANNAPIDPGTAQYIGISANAGTTPARTGTLGRNTLRTPGLNNWDFNVQKTIAITESVRLQFRTEFFNFFNHPQPGNPSVSPFSPGQEGISANVFTSPAGRFLNSTFPDAGGRVIRWQLKLAF
jgi:outer membrane receptor protein involved in Fe transport